jgi:hypothetical protein
VNLEELAQSLDVAQDDLLRALETVPVMSEEEQKKALVAIQRIADVLAHIGDERKKLLGRLASIASLTVIQ